MPERSVLWDGCGTWGWEQEQIARLLRRRRAPMVGTSGGEEVWFTSFHGMGRGSRERQ